MRNIILKEKISTIEKLLKKGNMTEIGESIFLIHAVLFTIDIDNVINLFIKTKDSSLKASLEYHLSRRLKDESLNLKTIFTKLLRKALKVDYSTHQRIRKLLSIFIRSLPLKYRQKYFNYFSSTGYVNDLSAALKISDTVIWDTQFDQYFIQQFLDTGNEKYLDAVLRNGNAESFINYIDKIWEYEFLNNRLKSKIIRKIAPSNLQCLAFLEDVEPDKYLYAVSMSNKRITDNDAENLFNKLNKEQLSFGLWCLGKLGKWEILKKYLYQYVR